MKWKQQFIFILTLAAVQLCFIFYCLSLYGNDKIHITDDVKVIRLSINGKDMFCAPKTKDASTDSMVLLMCSENMRHIESGVQLLHSGSTSESPKKIRDVISEGKLLIVNKTKDEYERRLTESMFKRDPDGYVNMFDETKPMDFHCDVCAVVSASGHLLGSKAGAEIDSANCVIRMNIAPTKGYEVDVGTRTSLRFAGFPNLMYGIFKANKIFEREKLPEKLLIWSGNTPQIRSVVKGEAKFLKKNHTGLDMYITTDREMKFHDELFAMETGKNRDSSKSWLSTGWFSIVLALKRCNRVKVYGMVEANHCEKTTARLDIPFHYYSMDNGYECMFYRKHEIGLKEGHRFFTEKYVFKKWARYFNLTFHYPEWDISKDDQRTPFLIKKTQSIPNPRYGVKRGPLPANFGNVREQNVRFPRTIEELRNNRFRPEKV